MNNVFTPVADMLEKMAKEQKLEIARLKLELQNQKLEISSLKEQLATLTSKPNVYKFANTWYPNEIIQSNNSDLWGKSGLFKSQWSLQYAIRHLGCPFVAVEGFTRKRVCKASDLEAWFSNPDVRAILEKTEKMRKKHPKME